MKAESLPAKWRRQAKESREEAGRIRRTVKGFTDAEKRCLVRAELWEKCAEELEESLPKTKLLPPVVSRLESDFIGKEIPPEIQRQPCSTCGGIILLAPASVALIDEGVARPLCPGCLEKEVETGSKFIPVMSPEQGEELKKYRRADTERN